MRKALLVLTLATVLLFAMSAMAHNKVTVIPLNSAKKLKNVVTVSAKGGDFTDPVAAVTSITAGVDNPYLVIIGPGIYTLTETLIMKSYVYIVGSGQDATTLTGAISTGLDDSSSAIVSGANNSTLSDLTVENIGGSTYSYAIYNSGSSPVIQDVTATASGGTGGNFGVRNISSSPTMTNLTVTASGDSNNRGVYNSSSSPTMTNLTVIASGGAGNNYGVYNSSSSPTMTNVTATALGGGNNIHGVHNISSSLTMTNVTASASGGTSNYGLYNNFSSSIIRHCTIDGASNGIFVVGNATTWVMQSSIIGGVNIDGPTLNCVNSDDGAARALTATCQ